MTGFHVERSDLVSFSMSTSYAQTTKEKVATFKSLGELELVFGVGPRICS